MIAVIGASGFIGRSLTDHLNTLGREYVALLRDPRSVEEGSFSGASRITAFEIGGDMDMAAFDGVDTVVVSTSATKPNLRFNGIVNEVQKNVLPHCQLFSALTETAVRHVIYLSSGGAVYGNIDQDRPITEAMRRRPCTPYGYGKMCIETGLENLWQGEGPGGPRRYTIIRPSNPVGPHQMQSLGAHGLIPTVLYNIHMDKQVDVFGDGTTVRDYFSADDLSRLVMRVTDSDPSVGSSVINASSGTGLSINEIIAACAAATGKRPLLNHITDKQPDIAYNVLDNGRARALFGWVPEHGVEEIVEAMKEALIQRAPAE